MHRFSLLLIGTLLFCGEALSPTPGVIPVADSSPVSAGVPAVTPSPVPKAALAVDSLSLPEEGQAAEVSLGVGLVKPHLQAGQRLYFYSILDFTQLPDTMTPVDSLVFGQGDHHVEITMAPPWFWPEVMKMDYDLLFLRAKTLSKNWVEVVVNRETGQTSWIDRHAVAFIDWPAFLLDVYTVEVMDQAANPVRIKALDQAAVLADASIPLAPLAVQGSWLQVSTNGLADRIPPTGWIRWRDGDRLLITFSLLS